MLIPGLDRLGGAERQLLLLAAGLRRRGWQVSVVVLSGHAAGTATGLSAAGIAFTSLEMRKGLADPRGWLRFHRWLQSERPDVIHAHLPHAAWLARWSRLVAPIPLLIDTLHSSATGGLGRRLGYRITRHIPDHVTAVSQAVADAHCKARMVNPRTLSILPNGIDIEVFCPNPQVRALLRRALRLADKFVWLAMGRLDAVKDYPTLLQAMTGVPEPARLLIAGEGPRARELHALAIRLGVEGRVRFLGFVPRAERWMQAADGFVLSSLWEGLPIALLEAGACALPAVATDVPGTREAMIESGYLVPRGDPAALAAAMKRFMLLSRDERLAMGLRAQRQVTERFNLEAVLDQWERLYRDAGKKRRGRSSGL